MGDVIRLKCISCKTDEQLHLGSIMSDKNNDLITGFCHRCGKYGSYLRNIYTDTIIEKCSCGDSLETVLTQEMMCEGKKPVCPKCGRNLEIEILGLFD